MQLNLIPSVPLSARSEGDTLRVGTPLSRLRRGEGGEVLLAAILLIGVAVRLPTLIAVPMWWDEVWTMWQTQGSLVQAIRLTPYNWPPGYYALMQIWTSLVGHNDLTGRYFFAPVRPADDRADVSRRADAGD